MPEPEPFWAIRVLEMHEAALGQTNRALEKHETEFDLFFERSNNISIYLPAEADTKHIVIGVCLEEIFVFIDSVNPIAVLIGELN